MEGIVEEEEEYKPKIYTPYWIENPLPLVNTSYFQDSANHFRKHNCYTKAPKGTHQYNQYWKEEYKRCKFGYTHSGVTITGRHYFYLNFCRIKVMVKENGRDKKKMDFPLFLDMDYYYFKEIDICLADGLGIAVLKARRKGFSFKNASLCAYEYTFETDSFCVIGAYYKVYSDATFAMFAIMANFLCINTEFGRQRISSQKDNYHAGYEEYVNGQTVIKGINSQVVANTFSHNTSAVIGKSISLMLWEEIGKWNNILECYGYTLDTMMEGNYMTGLNVLFGTGGDMESGATNGFERLFYNPHKYKLRTFDAKVYDEKETNLYAGLFLDTTWFYQPYVTENGYSEREKAFNNSNRIRKMLDADSLDDTALLARITQHPHTPKEAFLVLEGTYFPVEKIKAQIERIGQSKTLQEVGKRGTLELVNGKAEFKQDDSLKEASYPYNPKQKHGCVVIYEQPEKVGKDIPFGLYIGATDPYMHDNAVTSDSLGSTFIYKKFYKSDKTSNIIVAEYTGSPETTDAYYENVRRLLMYYNAKCLYENQFKDMKGYFEKTYSLHLLAQQPTIIKDIIPNSKVSRGYGIHMPTEIKVYGLQKSKEWLNSNKSAEISNISEIYSLNLLMELLKYTRAGNFDRVSAFLVLMIYLEETHRIQFNNLETEAKTGYFDKLFNNLFK